MPSIKTSELRSKNEDQLKKQLEDLSKESFNLRFQSSNGQLSNTGRVKEVRKGIAKVKTILTSRMGELLLPIFGKHFYSHLTVHY